MWSSSNMFLKKLITNYLCLFPNYNKNKRPSCPVSPSFTTHLSRHFSTHHNKNEKILTMIDTSTSKSTTNDDDCTDDKDVFFTSSSNHSQHLIKDHHFQIQHQHQQQQPDFATALSSNRFFISSPGNSKSLISNPPQQLQNISKTNNNNNNNSGSESDIDLLLMTGGVPVLKHTPDPYSDFKKSMQEMMEARSSLKDQMIKNDEEDENWEEYMHQLLTCYLTLNPSNTHECIINAFSDLLVTFILDKTEL